MASVEDGNEQLTAVKGRKGQFTTVPSNKSQKDDIKNKINASQIRDGHQQGHQQSARSYSVGLVVDVYPMLKQQPANFKVPLPSSQHKGRPAGPLEVHTLPLYNFKQHSADSHVSLLRSQLQGTKSTLTRG